MKKLIPLLALAFLFVGCDKQEPIVPEKQSEEVSVYFTFNLSTDNGNSMTKATSNEDVFNEFYAKLVDASLVAESYSLTLTEVNSGAKYEFTGKWQSRNMVTLRTGTYHVVGTSTASGDYIQEKCSLTFDEQIDVSVSSNTIELHAQYDCFLIVFVAKDVASISNFADGLTSSSLFAFGDYKYAFVNSKLFIENKRDVAYLGGTYTNGAEFRCYTGNLSFNKGKYYVYNSVTGGFTLPKMEEGESEGGQTIYTAVDLGLSVKWCSMNLGAEKESDYGNRYAWGETATKTSYTWDNYKWCMGNYYSFTKYCTNPSYGEVDNLTILESSDDAARVNMGGNWRMPTVNEANELFDNCTWTSETINGIKGYRVTGKNSNSIFIPANGQHDETGIQYAGINVYLWLNQCNGTYKGYVLTQTGVSTDNDRHDGLGIRAVENSI